MRQRVAIRCTPARSGARLRLVGGLHHLALPQHSSPAAVRWPPIALPSWLCSASGSMPVTAAEYGGTLPSAVETPPSLFAWVDAQVIRGKKMSAAASHWYF